MRNLTARKNGEVLIAVARSRECVCDGFDGFRHVIGVVAAKINLLNLKAGEF